MAGVDKLFDGNILNKLNQQIDLNDHKYKGKVIGLYFSAHWCPPCRRFTPTLAEFYNKYHEEKNFEIIFLSSDNDKKTFDEYYEEMPWLTLDYKERKKKEQFGKQYHVIGIPTFILFDGDSGEIICRDVKDQTQEKDPKVEYFPWKSI